MLVVPWRGRGVGPGVGVNVGKKGRVGVAVGVAAGSKVGDGVAEGTGELTGVTISGCVQLARARISKTAAEALANRSGRWRFRVFLGIRYCGQVAERSLDSINDLAFDANRLPMAL